MFAGLHWREPLGFLLLGLPWLPLLLGRLLHPRRGRFADARLMPWLMVPGRRRLVSRYSAYVLAWGCLALAAAGPETPKRTENPASVQGPTLLAVVDMSRSMRATDVSPNRLQRARRELYELLQHARGSRVGVLVFAGRPHLYVPPTGDFHALTDYLAQLDQLQLPTRGSRVALALEQARGLLADSRHAAVVLLSDGDFGDQQGAAETAAAKLHAAGIPLYVLGIGTSRGAGIPGPDGEWLSREGVPVVSRLHQAGLERLARQGGGKYQDMARGDADWSALYNRGMAGPAASPVPGSRADWLPLFQWPLSLALPLFVVALLPLRAGSTACLMLVVFSGISARQAEANQADAYAAYQGGEYALAAKIYGRLPGYQGRLGQGSCYFRLSAFPRAVQQFKQAVLAAHSERERGDALYNLGNSLFRLGDYAGASRVYRDVLLYREDDDEAQYNLALSQALQEQVARRFQSSRPSFRAGHGPAVASAPENRELESGVTITLGKRPDEDLPLPTLPENSEALIRRGLAHLQQEQQRHRDASAHWQADMARAHLYMEGVEDNPSRLWQRIFEAEEGFPAPQSQPRPIPGVRPW